MQHGSSTSSEAQVLGSALGRIHPLDPKLNGVFNEAPQAEEEIIEVVTKLANLLAALPRDDQVESALPTNEVELGNTQALIVSVKDSFESLIKVGRHMRVGLLGATGNGKTTLINRLCGHELLPTAYAVTGTATITEVLSWPDKDYEVRVEFMDDDEWATFVQSAKDKAKVIFEANNADLLDLEYTTVNDMITHDELSYFHQAVSALGLKEGAWENSWYTMNAIEFCPVDKRHHLNRSAIKRSTEWDDDMVKFTDEHTAFVQSQWPLVKIVEIRGPFQSLDGYSLLDIPGSSDCNEIMMRRSNEGAQLCNALFAVQHSKRLLTPQSINEVVHYLEFHDPRYFGVIVTNCWTDPKQLKKQTSLSCQDVIDSFLACWVKMSPRKFRTFRPLVFPTENVNCEVYDPVGFENLRSTLQTFTQAEHERSANRRSKFQKLIEFWNRVIDDDVQNSEAFDVDILTKGKLIVAQTIEKARNEAEKRLKDYHMLKQWPLGLFDSVQVWKPIQFLESRGDIEFLGLPLWKRLSIELSQIDSDPPIDILKQEVRSYCEVLRKLSVQLSTSAKEANPKLLPFASWLEIELEETLERDDCDQLNILRRVVQEEIRKKGFHDLPLPVRGTDCKTANLDAINKFVARNLDTFKESFRSSVLALYQEDQFLELWSQVYRRFQSVLQTVLKISAETQKAIRSVMQQGIADHNDSPNSNDRSPSAGIKRLRSEHAFCVMETEQQRHIHAVNCNIKDEEKDVGCL